MLPVQGGTIFGALPTAGATHGATILDGAQAPVFAEVVQAITEDRQAVSEFLQRALQTSPQPPVPLPSPKEAPAYWIVYNRWTGRYVADANGAETSDQNHAYQFPTLTIATSILRSLQGTAITVALTQPPPDDPPSCSMCELPQARAAATCPHCGHVLQMSMGWVHIFPHAADGRGLLGSVTI